MTRKQRNEGVNLKLREIYKTNDLTSFSTLCREIEHDKNLDGIEVEFRLINDTNSTPHKIFKSLLNSKDITIQKFSDLIVESYETTIPVQNLRYRGYIDPSSTSKTPFKYESKERLISLRPKLEINAIGLSVKIAKERILEDSEVKTLMSTVSRTNYQRLFRFTTKHNKFPCLKIDFSVRVYSDSIDELLKVNITPDMIRTNDYLKTSCELVKDIELELIEVPEDGIINLFSELIGEFVTKDSKYNAKFIEYDMLIDFAKIPNVLTLSNSVLLEYDIKDLCWLEKTDGLRTLIIIDHGKVYTYSANVFKEMTDKFDSKLFEHLGLTVLDTERYEEIVINATANASSTNTEEAIQDESEVSIDESQVAEIKMKSEDVKKESIYYVFDVYWYDGNRTLSNESGKEISAEYTERLKLWSDAFRDLNNIKPKIVHEIESWATLKEFVDTTHICPETQHVIDGVIIQHKHEMKSWKFKPARLNTVDCQLIWHKLEKCFYLFLVCHPNLYNHPMRKVIRQNWFSVKYDKERRLEKKRVSDKILFETPFDQTTYKFVPRLAWNTEGYTDREIGIITTTMKKMMKTPARYDECIFEMSFDGFGWVPLRARYDKTTPNGYMTGLGNMAALFNPVDPNVEKYFASSKKENQSDIAQSFHESNKIIRQSIFSRNFGTDYQEDKHRFHNVIDLCGGRGGDMQYIYGIGGRNIMVVDADKDALVKYVYRVCNFTKEPGIKTITLNVVDHFLSKNNDELLDKIDRRNDYSRIDTDLIVMNYALHYVCSSYPSLIEFKRTLKQCLNIDGRVLLTFYDGDKINVSYKNINYFDITPYEVPLQKSPLEFLSDKTWTELQEVLDLDLDQIFVDTMPIYTGPNLIEFITKETNDECYKPIQVAINTDKKYKYRIAWNKNYTTKEISKLSSKVEAIFKGTYTPITWFNMPLPTISATGYKSEPLVKKEMIDFLMDEFEIVSEDYPMLNRDVSDKIANNPEIKVYFNEYLECIKTIVLRHKC